MRSKNIAVRVVALILLTVLFNAALVRSEAKSENKTPLTVYSNTAPITINTAPPPTAPTAASLYPSPITVSGMTGTTTRVAVSLRGLTHGQTNDTDFLLVSPTGGKFVFLSDPTGNNIFNNNDSVVSFSDDAPTTHFAGTPLLPGSYKPINFQGTGDTFPAPAPAGPYIFPSQGSFSSVFNGADPNGVWSLYAVDDTLGVAGSINSGWELTITTSGAPQTFSNSAYIGLDDTVVSAAPFGSTINVSGVSGVISNLKVMLNGLTHIQTQDIDILLVSPNGRASILMSDTGTGTSSGVNLTFDDTAATTIPNTVIPSGTYRPTNNGNSSDDSFPTPAPFRPYFEFNNQLSNFNNFSPNGDWTLYVVDDRANDAGTIAGGWSLDITTSPVQPPPVGCAFPSLVPTTSAVGGSPTNLAVGDFNNDTKQDLAVTNQVSGDVSILLGNGLGGFLPQTLVTAGTSPYDVKVGRFNADSNDDLVVANSGSNNVSILLGNGNGTFSAPVNFSVGANPISITVGDINNDGKQDLAAANFGGFFAGAVSILLGNGSGGFGFPTNLRTRTQPAFVKLGNLNGDGNLDLVVANFGSNSISTFFGSGTGTFTISQNLNAGSGPVSVDIGNFDSNSFTDLVVADYNGDDVRIFFGTGGGLFDLGFSSGSVGANPISVVAADILGDGSNKLAVALSGSATISVSTLTLFTNFQQFLTGSNPNAIVKGDFNGDGKVDLATANFGSNDVTVLINTCIAANGNIFDFNGDRRTDFSVFRAPLSQWWFFPLNNQIIFARDTDKIVPADYDGDRQTDLAVFRPENGLWNVVKSDGAGNWLGTTYFLQFGLATDLPVPADFDGDGKADLAVFRPADGTWYIRRSSDNALQVTQFGMTGDKPVPADYDGDGKADLAVFRPSTSVWYIWQSSDGQFAIQQFGISTDLPVANDYDGDNKADIAVFRDGIWYVSKSSDQNVIVQGWGLPGDIPVAGDYEGDGRFDFAVFRPADRTWYILRSSDGGTQGFQYGITTDIPLPSAYVR